MSYELLGIVTLLVLILIGAGFGFWLYRRKSPFQRELSKLARAVGHAEFVDTLLPDGMGGEIHIERLLLTNRGFLLIDTRDVQGMVSPASACRSGARQTKGAELLSTTQFLDYSIASLRYGRSHRGSSRRPNCVP